jgi:hypothetical protein
MHGMRDETKGSRTLAHLDVASGSLRRPSWSGGWIIGVRGESVTPSLLPAVLRIPECIPCELRASHGSTAAPLSSAASSSASLAVRLLQTHPIGLPHRSLLRLLRYPRPNCLAPHAVSIACVRQMK